MRTWGQNFKNMVPIEGLLIWRQVLKCGDFPPKMGKFDRLMIASKYKLNS